MTVYFAFKPPREPVDDPVEDMGHPNTAVSLYDTELEHAYTVPDADDKIRRALESLPEPPHTYQPARAWVRVEYEPLVERGEVKRP
jgi:hypothetical protein